MPGKEKILVVFDSSSPVLPDQNMSELLVGDDWATERNILKTLKELGHSVEVLCIYDNLEILAEKIKTCRPDIIFNLIESFKGQSYHERDIASFLQLTGIPFTGCGATGITLCKNKGLSKEILSYHRIRVPKFAILKRKKRIYRPKYLPFPIIVKPLGEEASYGISQASLVENEEQFQERVRFIQESLNHHAIAEEYIAGRELYVGVLGNHQLQVFPVREMEFRDVPDESPKIATYKAKWDYKYRKKWGIRNKFAENIEPELLEKIKNTCKRIYRGLLIQGYARLDLRLTEEGKIVFLEANPNPILAAEEDFAESAKKAGISYQQLIQKIINLSKTY